MIRNNRIYWSFLQTDTVTVRVEPRSNIPAEIYVVRNVIDTGAGEQKVMLDHQGYLLKAQTGALNFDVMLPGRVDDMQMIYAGQKNQLGHDLESLVSLSASKCLEQIIPDIVRPGDVLVFKKHPRRDQMTVVEAFRPVSKRQAQIIKGRNTAYAL